MALPITQTVWIDQGRESGGWISTAGAVYIIDAVVDTVPATDTLVVDILKSADPDSDSSFTVQDASNNPVINTMTGNATTPGGISGFVRADRIYLVISARGTGAGAVHSTCFACFDMASDAWVDVDTSTGGTQSFIGIDSPQDGDGNFTAFPDVVVRDDGVVILSTWGAEAIHGTLRAQVFIYRSPADPFDGGAWTSTRVSDAGAGNNYVSGSLVLGLDRRRVHIDYSREDGSTEEIIHKTFSGSNSLQSAQEPNILCQNISSDDPGNGVIGPSVSLDRGGSNPIIRVMYQDESVNSDAHSLEYDDIDSPTSFSGPQVEVSGLQSSGDRISMVTDGDVVWALFMNEIEDDAGSDNWSSGATATITDSRGSYLFQRNGKKVITILGTEDDEYDERDITAAALTQLDQANMPIQNFYVGPFQSDRSGTLAKYSPLIMDSGTEIVMMKTTVASPGNTDWDSVDDPIYLRSLMFDRYPSYIVSLWSYQHIDDTIHVGVQQDDGCVTYSVFDPASETWTIQGEAGVFIGVTNFDEAPIVGGVSLALRSNGEVILVATYNNGTNDEARVFKRTTAGVWSDLGDAGGTLTNSRGLVVFGPDSLDRITWAMGEGGDNVELKSVSSGDTVSSVTVIDAAADEASGQRVSPGAIDANDRISVSYVDADNQLTLADWPSGASPSVTLDTTYSTQTVNEHSGAGAPHPVHCLVIDGLDRHTLYADDTAKDIRHINEAQTDAEIVDAVTANRISANVLGDVGIGIIYDDGGTTKYHAESFVAISVTTLADADLAMGPQSSYHGPFDV